MQLFYLENNWCFAERLHIVREESDLRSQKQKKRNVAFVLFLHRRQLHQPDAPNILWNCFNHFPFSCFFAYMICRMPVCLFVCVLKWCAYIVFLFVCDCCSYMSFCLWLWCYAYIVCLCTLAASRSYTWERLHTQWSVFLNNDRSSSWFLHHYHEKQSIFEYVCPFSKFHRDQSFLN